MIISVSRAADERVYDIEVPAGMSAGHLVGLIAQSMGWGTDASGRPIRYRAEVHPHGRLLSEGETLAQAGVWDGAWLVLHPPVPAEDTPGPEPRSQGARRPLVRRQPRGW